MGIGKTTITIAVCHIQHIFNLMYQDIRKRPNDHLAKDKPKDNQHNVACPSNQKMYQKFGFDCPCAESSVTSCVKENLGVHGILAPLGLLDNWCKEWKACYANSEGQVTKKSNPFQMKLVLGHTNARVADGNQLDDTRLADMKATVDLGDANDRDIDPICTPTVINSRVIIVTTSHSFMSQLLAKFRGVKRVDITPPSVQKLNKHGEMYTTKPKAQYADKIYHALVFSSLWRDEAHKEWLGTSQTLTLLQGNFFSLPQNQHIHLNIMSGTLITSGPLDIASYVKVMVRPTWKYHRVLRNYCEDEINDLGTNWDKLVKQGTADEAASQNVIKVLQPVIEATTLRFTPDSNFLGTGPVVTLPPNVYSEVACTHSAPWTERLLLHKQQEDDDYARRENQRRKDHVRTHGSDKNYTPLVREGVTFHYRSRLFASFPYLMDLTQESGEPLRFTEAEWKGNRKNWEGTKEPYMKHIREIAASSGKLKRIGEKIQEWSDKIDGEGKPARLIFCSFFLVGARIIYLWMVHILKIPEDDILFIHKVLSQKKINEAIAKFHGNEAGKQPRYIVATSSAFGVGLTLSEAVAIGLLEPDYTVATELQLFCRHNRLGNRNRETYSWLFFALGNEREETIRRRNHIRKKIDKALEGKMVT